MEATLLPVALFAKCLDVVGVVCTLCTTGMLVVQDKDFAVGCGLGITARIGFRVNTTSKRSTNLTSELVAFENEASKVLMPMVAGRVQNSRPRDGMSLAFFVSPDPRIDFSVFLCHVIYQPFLGALLVLD